MSQKNNLKHHINHQTQTDLASEWFNFDKKFKAKRFASFINYKVSFAHQASSNWLSYSFNSFQINLLKLSNFMSKNIITILATILLVLGLGGATAQAFAPEDLKPLTIIQKTFNPKDFASNELPDKNPYTALKPDGNNDVANLKECDLSIKYPKIVNNTKVLVFLEKYSNDGIDSNNFSLEDGTYRSDDYGETDKITALSKTKFNNFSISCVPTEALSKNIGLYTPQNAPADFIKWTKQDLQKQLGWLVTEADITDIMYWDNGGGSTFLYFTYNNKVYSLFYANPSIKSSDLKDKIPELEKANYYDLPGIFADQVQIQFNSLVVNEDNVKVVERSQNPTIPTPQNDKDNTKPTLTNSNPVDGKQIIKVEPKDPSLVKMVNPKNGISKGVHDDIQTCGVEGVVQYSTSDYVSGNMRISSTELNLNSSELESYNRLNDFLGGKIEFKPDFANNIQYINQFIDSCGVIYNHKQLIEAPQISYPGTDKVKTVYALTGQALYMDPVVQVYAQKGNDQIWLESTVSIDKFDSLPVAQSCGWKTGNYGEVGDFDQKCYEDKLKQDPKLKVVLDQMAKDLIKTFELK